MTPRSHSKSVVFSHPFELKGVDRILPAGDYRVVTDEELIEELSKSDAHCKMQNRFYIKKPQGR
jgi:hypothetical protein